LQKLAPNLLKSLVNQTRRFGPAIAPFGYFGHRLDP